MGVNLAEKIRRLKEKRSYADIAREVGCSSENVRKIIDQGSHPGFFLGVRLARALGVPVDWLADDDQDWPPPEPPEKSAEAIVREALTGAGLTGELAEEERKLLAQYRALNPMRKPKLEGFIEGLGGDSGRRSDNDGGPSQPRV